MLSPPAAAGVTALAPQPPLHGTPHGDAAPDALHVTRHGVAAGATSQAPAASNPASGLRAGMQLGTTGAGVKVVVVREIGASQGYDDRWQAVAVARMSGAPEAAVAQGRDGRWHAVETNAPFDRVDFFVANDTPVLALQGLPSAAAIAAQQRAVRELEGGLRALPLPSAADGNAGAMRRSELLQDLSRARSTLASMVLGIDASELQFNAHSSGRAAGKVNITGQPGQGSSGGAHGPVGGQGHAAFRPGLRTAIEIDLPQLDRPLRAQATLFHETTHLLDHQLAQRIVRRFETSTGTLFDGDSPVSRMQLDRWLQREVAQGRLGAADAELTSDEAAGRTSTTEARANVRTAIAALQAGAAGDAKDLLAAYAKALPPAGRQYASPPPGSHVVKELVIEARAAWKAMTADQRAAWNDAVAAAAKANPQSWIVQLQFRG